MIGNNSVIMGIKCFKYFIIIYFIIALLIISIC